MKKSQWKRKIWIWNVKSYVIGLGIPSNFENLPDLKHNFLKIYWDYNSNILKVIRLSQSPVQFAVLRLPGWAPS